MIPALPTLLLAGALSLTGGDPGRTPVDLEKELYAWSIQSLQVPASAGQPFQVAVVFDEWFDAALDLEPYSLRSPGFTVWEQGADGQLRAVEVGGPVTYRGMVAGMPGSAVSASIVAGQLRARINLNDGSTVRLIQPLSDFDPTAARDLHLVYDSADVVPDSGHVMAEPLLPPGLAVPNAPSGGSSAGGAGHDHAAPGAAGGSGGARADKTAQVACDADYPYYQKNGSNSTNTVNDIESVLNDVETIYQVDVGICYDLTQVVVRTSSASDPYTTTDPGALLDQFRSEWLNNQGGITRDVAQLFTGRALNGSVIGIAWLGGVCNSFGYSVVESRYTTNWSRRVSLSAHELGHNWNAGHCCSSCSGCSTCNIMCPCNGGCSGNVSHFGTASINAITSYKNSRTCLTSGCGGTTGPLTIAGPYPGIAGQSNSIDITGGAPSALVTTYYSQNSGFTAVSGCTGLYLGLQNPKVAAIITVNTSGAGSFNKNVPASAAGRTFLIQAVDSTSCQISNILTHTF